LGFIDPNVTVNVIVGSRIVDKKRIAPPRELVNVVKCKIPRCITSTERELPQIFARGEHGGPYRCRYCEQEYQKPTE
jgi:aspartate carbamoyltransferase regulatory subunit